jgi:hypothetical protein
MTGTHNLIPGQATTDGGANTTRHPREGPTFDIVFRGYDRASVDDYVVRLHEWIIASETRAESAAQAAADARVEANELHRRLVDLEQHALMSPEAGGAVGERVADILRTSLEAGAQARKTAEAHAARIIEEGQQHATEVVLSAEQRAQRMRERADSAVSDAQARSSALLDEAEQVKAASAQEASATAEAILVDARRQREEVEATIRVLAEHRATVVDELDRLKDYLAQATSDAAAAARGGMGEDTMREHTGGRMGADGDGEAAARPVVDADADAPGQVADGAPTDELQAASHASDTTERMETRVSPGPAAAIRPR